MGNVQGVDITGGMAFEPSLEEQELLADTLARRKAVLTSRERVADTLVGVSFLAAVVALLVLQRPHAFDVGPAALCLVLMVVATMVRFDTPFGFTVATQLAFVPLLFAMPVSLVPIAVVLALALVRLRDVASGKIRPIRLLKTPGNAWFAIGPVAVF